MKQENNLATRKMMLATLGVLVLAALVGLTLSMQPTNKTFAQEKDAPKIQENAPNNPTSPTACVQSPSGLVSWYRAEGNANDARGLNNGTLQNGATFADGRVGQAFSFDGVNDFVQLPNNALLNPSSITVEGWINPQTVPLYGVVFTSRDPLVTEAFTIAVNNTGSLDVNIRVVGNPNGSPDYVTSAPNTIQFGQFQHIAVTYNENGGGTLAAYLNGVPVQLNGTVMLGGAITPTINHFVGRRQEEADGGRRYYKGLIDELSIYNRALSATEIQSIFNAGSDGKCLASVRKQFDFDGDGRADQAVFRPSNGVWYLLNSQSGFSASQFGISTDRLAPADYDGDGRTDIAVYRDGIWYLLRSTAGFTALQFGIAEDIPLPADYDGDGRADIAVFRPSSATWYLLQSTAGVAIRQFGTTTDKPLIGDFDGDGKTDLAVQRTTGDDSGTWFILQSSNNQEDAVPFGLPTDKAAPADYDGDGKTDIAVFRRGTWYFLRSTANKNRVFFGLPDDVPTPADYDGDGRADIGVYRPSNGTWYRQNSTNGQNTSVQFGISEDRAIPNAFVR